MIRDIARADLMETAQCRYGRMLYLKNDQYMGRHLQTYGEYSEGEVELWRQFVKPHWSVADIGANIGVHTLALASLAHQGTVLSIEPVPFVYRMLCANLALNAITNVVPLQAAAGFPPRTLRVGAIDYTHEDTYGGFPMGPAEGGPPVAVLPLDSVLQKVDFIKVDVEGMELEVLKGAQQLIDRFRPVLYVEANPGPTQAPLLEHLHNQGYDLWWHKPSLFNPDNYKQSKDEWCINLISHNVIALPSHPDNHMQGFEKAYPPPLLGPSVDK